MVGPPKLNKAAMEQYRNKVVQKVHKDQLAAKINEGRKMTKAE